MQPQGKRRATVLPGKVALVRVKATNPRSAFGHPGYRVCTVGCRGTRCPQIATSSDRHFDLVSVGGALPSARTFDLSVRLRGDPEHPIVFSALNKEELQTIEDFLHMKKIKVKNEMDELAAVEAAVLAGAGDDSSDEDDDDDAMDVDGAASGRKSNTRDAIGQDLDDEDSEGELD